MSLFFDAEQAIVARLTEVTAGMHVKVLTAIDQQSVRDRSQGEARIYVMYNGIVEHRQAAPTVPQLIDVVNQWVVLIAVRSASRHDSGDGNRQLADPLMCKTLKALAGFKADGAALSFAGALDVVYSDSGFNFYPLLFNQRRCIRGLGDE